MPPRPGPPRVPGPARGFPPRAPPGPQRKPRYRFYQFFMGCILEDGEGKIQPSTPPVGVFSKEEGMVRHPHRPKLGQKIGPPRRMEKGQSHGVPPEGALRIKWMRMMAKCNMTESTVSRPPQANSDGEIPSEVWSPQPPVWQPHVCSAGPLLPRSGWNDTICEMNKLCRERFAGPS